jgi:hypothetical protein
MRVHHYIALVVVGLCVGCDPAVHTHLSVTPALAGSSRQPGEVVSVVRPILEGQGLGEMRGTNEPPSAPILFTDWFAGGNPHLWVTISSNSWPVSISFMERYTAHRSRKHKQTVKAVERALEDNEFHASKD